jgi:D-alanine-D-alanine ligase
VVVLTGGSTPERDVAFAGAAQVVAALRGLAYEVSVVDTTSGVLTAEEEARLLVPSVGREPPSAATLAALAARELGPRLVDLPAVRDADAVFPVLHGLQGEGGALQALLELADVPYAGSGPLGSALAMDKDVAKRLFRDAGIPTAAWTMWPASPAAAAALGFPLVVKPVKVGSTVGLTIVRRPADVAAAVEEAARYDDEVMLEAFVPGREFTVGVLGDRALAPGEIIPSHEIFDYECKYTPGLTREVFPADIPSDLASRLKDAALAAHRVLKLRDFSRVDFRVGPDGVPMCLEANTLPGLTGTSLLPQSAAAVGIPFPDLCDAICQAVLARKARGNKLPSWAGMTMESRLTEPLDP